MRIRIGKDFGPSMWVALVGILCAVSMFVVATAQDTLTQEITAQINAVAYDPDMAAGVVRDAVAGTPQQAEAIVRAAVQAAPHLSSTLTAAAVVPASDQVEPIQRAAADAAPRKARIVALAATVASKVVAHPERDAAIVSAAIRETPGHSTTVVTAAATVCRFVEGCSPISPMPIVKAAVTADHQAVESIVEATVSLFPSAAGEIIAVATQSAAKTKTVRQRAEPLQAELTLPLPGAGETLASDTPVIAAPNQPGGAQPVLVADNSPDPTGIDVVTPPAPTPSEFPSPTSSGSGDGTGSGDDDDDEDDDDDDGDGTGTGTGTDDITPPDLPPVFPASPFF